VSTGISIIVPTIGRPTLQRTLHSIIRQTSDLDQIVVVFDGHDYDLQPAFDILALANCEFAVASIEQLGEWGHPARNYALDNIVTRTRVMTMDDDDIYLPGAFGMIREALDAHPPAVHVFGCRWGPGHEAAGTVLPRGRGLLRGEIATPMIVAPTCLARYGAAYDGDWTYAQALASIFGEEHWHWHPDKVICEVRP
jgi:glycosyltransferase involved in cell wall biosynthesis